MSNASNGGDLVEQFADRYVLVERIAVTDHSAVWRAYDDVAGRRVALKIWPDQPPEWRTEFSRTGRALAALSHPSIATVYHHGDTGDACYLALAFVDATPLGTLVTQSGPLPATRVLDIVGQVGLALQAAHDAGMAHGGLTADDILIRSDNGVRLVGFAITAAGTATDDLRALGAIGQTVLSLQEPAGDAAAFLRVLAETGLPPRTGAVTGEDVARAVARSALALAAALTPAVATGTFDGPTEAEQAESSREAAASKAASDARNDIEDAARKRVRNRLIAIGVVVVLAGLVLLKVVGGGGAQVSVPNVIGLTYSQAFDTLARDGLNATEVVAGGGDRVANSATVIRQSAKPGSHLKAGSKITLTVSETAPS